MTAVLQDHYISFSFMSFSILHTASATVLVKLSVTRNYITLFLFRPSTFTYKNSAWWGDHFVKLIQFWTLFTYITTFITWLLSFPSRLEDVSYIRSKIHIECFFSCASSHSCIVPSKDRTFFKRKLEFKEYWGRYQELQHTRPLHLSLSEKKISI